MEKLVKSSKELRLEKSGRMHIFLTIIKRFRSDPTLPQSLFTLCEAEVHAPRLAGSPGCGVLWVAAFRVADPFRVAEDPCRAGDPYHEGDPCHEEEVPFHVVAPSHGVVP